MINGLRLTASLLLSVGALLTLCFFMWQRHDAETLRVVEAVPLCIFPISWLTPATKSPIRWIVVSAQLAIMALWGFLYLRLTPVADHSVVYVSFAIGVALVALLAVINFLTRKWPSLPGRIEKWGSIGMLLLVVLGLGGVIVAFAPMFKDVDWSEGWPVTVLLLYPVITALAGLAIFGHLRASPK